MTMRKVILKTMFYLAAATAIGCAVMFYPSTKQNEPLQPYLNTEPLGEFYVTAYRSLSKYTDNSPYWSSIGVRTNPWMVAVSPDWLKDKRLNYHDVVFIAGVGFKVVGDCMNSRHKNRFDVWVASYAEEKDFDKKFRGKKLKVYVIRRQIK